MNGCKTVPKLPIVISGDKGMAAKLYSSYTVLFQEIWEWLHNCTLCYPVLFQEILEWLHNCT